MKIDRYTYMEESDETLIQGFLCDRWLNANIFKRWRLRKDCYENKYADTQQSDKSMNMLAHY